MVRSLEILDINLDKAYYRPGEVVSIAIQLETKNEGAHPVRLELVIRHLMEVVETFEQQAEVDQGISSFEFKFTPPPHAPRGYGIDLCAHGDDGRELACKFSAFDVLENWTQSPRYGFLTDFSPERSDAEETISVLSRYHINGLQFYDWMFRHDQFITEKEPYRDPLNRLLSRTTVEVLIQAAHQHNIAAMPYTAIYAASVPFYETHQDWALYQASGDPFRLGEDFLIYMDPRPDSPWVEHLLSQFDLVLSVLDFDGIHLDQYGDPKAAQDARGNSFALDEPIASTIDATKELVRSHRSDGAVVFNAVNNWPIEAVAPSEQDFIYIEVWRPHIWFQDLHKLIVNAQEVSGGKAVVLAAYIDPSLEHNARLMDAVIFASGGGHIEIGENNGMLADPYFPKYEAMSSDLAAVMRTYYDFMVRYQDVIGPRTSDVSKEVQGSIEIEGSTTDHRLHKDVVWPIARRGDGFLAISLINLQGITSPEWAKAIDEPPKSLGPTRAWIWGLDRGVSRLWLADPDSGDPRPKDLCFELYEDDEGYGVSFPIPSLTYWGLVVIEWEE
jgi:dextranase